MRAVDADEPTNADESRSLPIDVGRRIGRFDVLHELGRGGMGVVVLGVDAELDRKVAIKVLSDRRLGESDRLRMQREAQALARLSHPHVVQVYEVGEHDGVLFVAMEHLGGPTLRGWSRTPHDWRETVAMYVQAARGLAAAHHAGLVHRDFKPENAMLGDDGRVRVLDFGLARLDAEHVAASGSGDGPSSSARALHVDVTRTGASVGTPAYMAPEQFLGEAVDARTDQFSFCVALFEALHGQRPFGGRTRMQLAAAVTRGIVEVPPHAAVPPRIRRVLLRGLAVDPRHRWPDLDALVDALTRPSRVARWTFAGVAALGVIGTVVYARQVGRVGPCDGAAEAIESTWNDERRGAVQAAFTATAVPWASDNLAAVEASLDVYVDAWRTARHDACAATRIEGTQSAERLDQRMDCLDARHRRLAATVEMFAAADAGVVERAVAAVEALPPIDRCEDPQRATTIAPPPDDPEVRTEVLRIEAEIAAAQTLLVAVRARDALARLEPELGPARALGFEPLLARILVAVGTVKLELADYEGGAALLREGYLVALRVADTTSAHEAALELARMLGGEQEHFDDAFEWLAFAEAHAQQPGADRLASAATLHVRGAILDQKGDTDASIDAYEQALAQARDVLPSDSLHLAKFRGRLAEAYIRRDRYVDAARELDASHEILVGRLGAHHPAVARVEFQRGMLASNDGRYEDALRHYRAADVVFAAAFEPNHPARAAVAHNAADALGKLGRYDEAIVEQRVALAAFTQSGGENSRNVAFALNNLGNMLRHLGKDDEALAELERSLAIRRVIYPADHPEIGVVFGNIALVLQSLRRFDDARVYQEQALALAKLEFEGGDHSLIATQLQNLGHSLDELGRHRDAEARLLEARAMWSRLGEADHPDAGAAEQGLAYVYRHMGRLDEAKVAVQRAFALRRTLGEGHFAVGQDLHLLGIIELERGAIPEAIEALRRALAIEPDADGRSVERTRARRRLDLAKALAKTGRDDVEARELATQADAVLGPAKDDRADEARVLLAGLAR